MDEVEKKALCNSVLEAHERVTAKLIGLQSGYILILNTINAALSGNETLAVDLKVLNKRLEPTSLSAEQFFLSILFLDAMSEMEIYLSNLIQIIVQRHPKKLGKSTFKLNDILDSDSIDELVLEGSRGVHS